MDIVNNAAITFDLTWSRVGEDGRRPCQELRRKTQDSDTSKGFISSHTVRITGVGVWP